MQVVILAGGRGARLADETRDKPKPMVTIGGRPILWHIMMHYGHFGFDRFVIGLGYRGDVIKRYFVDYALMHSNLTVKLGTREVLLQEGQLPNWTIQLVDTGLETMTGGRIRRLAPYVGDSTFMLTWGDGLSDVNLADLLAFHRSHGKLATVTAVRAPSRFGHLALEGTRVQAFAEKPTVSDRWINGAYFVLEPGVFDYIAGDDTPWERAPLEKLAREGQLMAYRHSSFWQCMDTAQEREKLEALWQTGEAPWAVWNSREMVAPNL